jgi:TIR domain
MHRAREFDLFLSFVSANHSIAERLHASLRTRGVRVWMDRDRLRPGDLFPAASAQGLAQCRAMGLVVTPESLASDWAQHEHDRARSLAKQGVPLVIPLLFGVTRPPDFLPDLNTIDFADADAYERNVDRIIWPGLTGREVIFLSVHPGRRAPWPTFRRKLNELGIRFVQGENINRARFHIRQIAKARTHRIVVVLDIFEDWPTYEWPRRNSPEQYVKFLLDVRRETAGTKDEVVILLFNHSEAFEKAGHSLNEQMLEQLSHCCSLHGDLEGAVFEARLRATWYRLQQELLASDTDDGSQGMRYSGGG